MSKRISDKKVKVKYDKSLEEEITKTNILINSKDITIKPQDIQTNSSKIDIKSSTIAMKKMLTNTEESPTKPHDIKKNSPITVSKTTPTTSVEEMSTDTEESPITSETQDILILNKNDIIETIQFSSDEMLESIQIEDSTVEIIGYVDEIDGPKIVGKTQQYRLLKFMVNNNSRHRIQFVAWNNEIERIQFHLKPNRIIHIDGAKAKKPKITDFNIGILPYELLIRSNTIINNLGIFDLKKNINNIKPKLIKIEDIPENLNNYIAVQGYVKTNFNTFSNNLKTYGYGSITDGYYKLEIQVINYENTNCFEKGQKIEVKGYVKLTNNNIFYLEVDKTSDMKLTEIYETITFAQCLQGSKPIIKRTQNNIESDLPNKISRI